MWPFTRLHKKAVHEEDDDDDYDMRSWDSFEDAKDDQVVAEATAVEGENDDDEDDDDDDGDLDLTVIAKKEDQQEGDHEGLDEEAAKHYKPYKNRQLISPVTKLEARIHLLNGYIGLGIIELPSAFRRFGVIYASIGLILMGVMTTHCIHILIKSMYRLYCRRHTPRISYCECIGYAVQDQLGVSPGISTKIGWFCSALLFMCQMFIAAAYVKYIGHALGETVDDLWMHFDFSEPISKSVMAIPLLLMSLLPSVKDLVYISGMGVICAFVATIIIMFDVSPDLDFTRSHNYMHIRMTEYPHFVGTAMFAFYILGTILLLEGNMKSAKGLVGKKGILNQMTFTVTVIYIIFAVLCAMTFNDVRTKRSIMDRLELPIKFAHDAKFFLILSCFFSHPLMCFEMFDIVWALHLNDYFEQAFHVRERASYYVIRTTIVCATVALAFLEVTDLSSIISSCGLLLVPFVVLIFPPFLQIATSSTLKDSVFFKDLLLMSFGFSSFIAGMYVLLIKIAT